MFYTYILQRGKNNEFYIGYSDNLKRRLEQHKRKYPCELVYYEAYLNEKQARERERKLKQYGSAWTALRSRLIVKRAG